ncbi:SIMPL domain-containing protein [Kribbella sp. CA-245084]|uniref:SIMPL domain-containing protein n=1 Tax=Kribbella sp. CA-245084 TaxID=3239940 RepID=UPI003D94F609
MDTGVNVVGSGQVTGAPDLLRISFGVEHGAPDVASAVARVGERTDAVIAALRGQGVEQSQLGTSAVSVYQEFKGMEADAPYRASHTITVVTKDLTGFGRLLNAAVDAAGNNLALHGLEFDIEDKAELLTRARELAFGQAKAKAEHLAALAGFSLGSVSAIAETQAHAPWVSQSVSLGGKQDAGVNIVPGGQEVQVSLQVQFAWA